MTEQPDNNEEQFEGGETTFISLPTDSRHAFLLGDMIGNAYLLTAALGRGGMGEVFACRHQTLGKDYAIKILNGDEIDGERWARFRSEAKALAQLNHPGIVKIHNMGVDGGRYPYYVMDLLSGETLDLLITNQGPLKPSSALDLFIQVADALSTAHSQGIIHRDIKPSNLMLLRDEQNNIAQIKLVDFGIARLSKQDQNSQSQTATGLIFGTPYYMSPEQCQGLRVDERSDIYSLGCALFESLTGSPPFRGENSFQTFMLHQTEPPPTLASRASNCHFSEGLEKAVAKMLAKKTTDRYQTMAQLKHDLERLRAGKDILKKSAAGQASLPIDKQSHKYDIADHNEETNSRPTHRFKIALSLTAATILVAALCLSVVPQTKTNKNHHKLNESALLRPDRVKSDGMENLIELNFDDFYGDLLKLTDKTDAYLASQTNAHKMFRRNGKNPGFLFPTDFYLGVLQLGEAKPFLASGFITVPTNQTVRFYLNRSSRQKPAILDKFTADDLTGLEIITLKPEAVLKKIASWHKLKEFSFFNSLMRAPSNRLDCEESVIDSNVLPAIDKMTKLRSLGLCCKEVDGKLVAKMHLLDSLTTLKLRRIKDIDVLLHVLPGKDNLRELWLIDEGTTDEQIKDLAGSNHLEILKIKRSKLTPASLSCFKQMKSLKSLELDTDWPIEDKNQFCKDLAACKFVQATDFTYWKMFPDQIITP